MNQTSRMVALVVAAGTGQRLGGALPKQYQMVAGKPLLRHAVERLLAHPAIAQLRVVIHPDHADLYEAAMAGLTLPPPITGGATRAASVRLGLEALADDAPDYIMIHDAARPFLPAAVIDRLCAAASPTVGVVPALPVDDTLRRRRADGWQEVPREALWRMQTPQLFPYGLLRAAHATTRGEATDDAAIWLEAGHVLEYVLGDEELRKVTHPADLFWAEHQRPMRLATGMGFDVHALMPAGEKHSIRLGGIDIAHDHALQGHSDADVVLHALVDAMLGAISAGDIGSHFLPSDARWKGADSALFVAEALRLVRARDGQIEQVDLTIICEAPKIGPHREAMRGRIAQLLQLPLEYVSVKATTTEQLGFTGRREGIAAQALVNVRLPRDTAMEAAHGRA